MIVVIMLFLWICPCAWAGNLAMLGGGIVTSSTDITFYSSFEGTISGTAYTKDATCSKDVDATSYLSNIFSETSDIKEGSKSLRFDTGWSDLIFAISGVSTSKGRFGVWYKPHNVAGNYPFLSVQNYPNNLINLYIVSTDVKTMRVEYISNGISYNSDTSAEYVWNTAVWQFIEVVYDSDADVLKLLINGSVIINTSISIPAMTAQPDRFYLGSSSVTYYDSAIYSTDPTRDLYSIALQSSCN